ncbi:hypothetical protein BDN72DRAFT_594251 [Pluteus cervinus]|uniref:Uncharacterized protein n=1 Tax=Pluteus cervinus TaxID=181527 RepID=A0ACD3A2F1_9AGAR|nr:hypothetical protein BDN72DRAFT_594251 [Pluteus cervinus]
MSQPMFSLQKQTLDNTIGAAFLGIVGASLLFGMTSVQAYYYYHAYPKDSRLHKCAVAGLWLLDAFHQGLIVHAVYMYIISGFMNPFSLSHIIWSIKLQIVISVVIIVIVHSLYAYRVWLLNGYHHGVIGYLVAAVVVGGFVIGIIFAIEVYRVEFFSELDNISWAVTSSLATATTIDFVIAAAMVFYLRKSKGTESRLNSRISKVMQYALGSGLLTSACSLSALFTYILLPNTFVFVGLEFLLTKLYVGSFLAMLNARDRKDVNSDDGSLEGTTTFKFQHSDSYTSLSRSRYRLTVRTSNLHRGNVSTTIVGSAIQSPSSAKSKDSRTSSAYPYSANSLWENYPCPPVARSS